MSIKKSSRLSVEISGINFTAWTWELILLIISATLLHC